MLEWVDVCVGVCVPSVSVVHTTQIPNTPHTHPSPIPPTQPTQPHRQGLHPRGDGGRRAPRRQPAGQPGLGGRLGRGVQVHRL